MLFWDTVYPLQKDRQSHSTSNGGSWQLPWPMCSSWNGFHKEDFLGNKAFQVSKMHSLEKERQVCAEKPDDVNGHTNKLLWGNFRLELHQDNCLYASCLPHHKYHFFYHVGLWAGIRVQLVHYSTTPFHILTHLFVPLNYVTLIRQLLKFHLVFLLYDFF